jgi:lipopolysaccharide export system protein LptA
MGRLLFLLFISLLYPAEVTIALDNDRDQPAIVDAQDIEIDFSTGQWIYRGDVTIEQGTLYMTADDIHLFFDNDVLQRAIAHGNPAVFRQQPEGSDHLIRGQAKKIEIDEIKNIAIFSGNAKLQQHRDTITGETIVYHMDTEKMTVRGNIAVPSQTTRLSSSETKTIKTNDMSELSTRPRIVIQPNTDVAPRISTNTSSEPAVLSIANDTDQELTNQSPDSKNSGEEEQELSDDSLQFRAARVIGAGTAAYSRPDGAVFLGGLSGHMPVKVLQIRDDWARVAIPGGINVWVFASYVVENDQGESRIEGRGVRARWLPSSNSRIVGTFEPGTRIRVLATRNNWKQVSLPFSIAIWVPMTQLEMLNNLDSAWKRDWAAQAEALPGIGN